MKDLGNASYDLGIQIYRDHSKDILGLSQKGYIEKLLKDTICRIVNHKILQLLKETS